MSTYTNTPKRGRHKQKHSVKKSARRQNKAIKAPAPSSVRFTATSTHHLNVDGSRLQSALTHLERSGLRYYVTGFLKDGLRLCVFINPFSVDEREKLGAIKSFFADG